MAMGKARTVSQERRGGHLKKYRTGKSYWYGIDKGDWESLLTKGASLATLQTTDLSEMNPDVSEIGELQTKVKHTPHYSGWGPWKRHIGDTTEYVGLGKEVTEQQTGRDLFNTAKQAKSHVDRVLGIFAKRKQEASLRQRAPGRAATMLTTKNKTQLTGY